MEAYIFNKIPNKIALVKSEVLYGPFCHIEDVHYFLKTIGERVYSKEQNFTEKEPTHQYWLLLKSVDLN